MMKKMTALLLAIVLFCTLAGCAQRPELLGVYETEIDLTSAIVTAFDTGAGTADTEFSLKHYLPDCKMLLRFTFREDGTYEAAVDEVSVQKAVQELEHAVDNLLSDYAFAAVKQQLQEKGFEVENRDDLTTYTDLSWDDFCTAALGIPRSEYAAQLVAEAFSAIPAAQYCGEGRYIAMEGKLHLSERIDAEPSEESYETYTVNGSTVTFTGAVNVTDTKTVYPYILTAVS